MNALFGTTGRTALDLLHGALRACVLVVDTTRGVVVAPLRGKGTVLSLGVG